MEKESERAAREVSHQLAEMGESIHEFLDFYEADLVRYLLWWVRWSRWWVETGE